MAPPSFLSLSICIGVLMCSRAGPPHTHYHLARASITFHIHQLDTPIQSVSKSGPPNRIVPNAFDKSTSWNLFFINIIIIKGIFFRLTSSGRHVKQLNSARAKQCDRSCVKTTKGNVNICLKIRGNVSNENGWSIDPEGLERFLILLFFRPFSLFCYFSFLVKTRFPICRKFCIFNFCRWSVLHHQTAAGSMGWLKDSDVISSAEDRFAQHHARYWPHFQETDEGIDDSTKVYHF